MANGWTAERRARHAALIHSWRPWDTARNADKGGQRDRVRAMLSALRLALDAQREALAKWAD